MFKYLPLLLLCCLGVNDISAQIYDSLLVKYWSYRDRLTGADGSAGFVDIGVNPGQSIPMAGRNIECDCEKDWPILAYGCDVHPGKGKMNWGDATVGLGHYIAMLTMEYVNLKRAGQNELLESTAQELYFALKAFERLDRSAEPALGFESKLDGFFLRDDVSANFYRDTTHTLNRRFSDDKTGYDCLYSNFSCNLTEVDGGGFVSQDQILGLLFGFAFVVEFMEDAYWKDSTETFVSIASENTHRIIDFCIQNKWRLKGPDGSKISNRWGGDLRGFNNLIAKTGSRICGKKYRKSYQKGSSRSIGWLIKGTFNWAYWAQAERNHWLIFASIVASNNWNSRKMARRTLKSDKVMYALAHAVLNKRDLHKKVKRNYLDELLFTAPLSGPCYKTPGCESVDGWKSSDRWIHSKEKNGRPDGPAYEWPGIDYMLFYNLYHYLYVDELPMYSRTKKRN